MIINIRQFINCPADVFNLHGFHRSGEPHGVPCRIKVGPSRFLENRVDLEKLELTLWTSMDNEVTYLTHQPVDVTTDKEGVVHIDAVALARKYFGKDISFCSKSTWRSSKDHPSSYITHCTDYGIATSCSTWLDISWNHSDVNLAPGTLKLCGHDVRTISWSSFGDACASDSEEMRPLVDALLSGPHNISGNTLRDTLENVKVLEEYGINRLRISTDRGSYEIDSSIYEHISVDLNEGVRVLSEYHLNCECTILDQVDIMLELMQATSAKEVHNTLRRFKRRGMLYSLK